MLLDIIKKLINRVDFSAEGADCEKLLRDSSNLGIEIKNLRKNAYVLSGTIFAKDYKKLHIPAKKAGIKLKIKKKKGPYFFIKCNIIKSGFILGIVFVSLIFCILNMFIWQINVRGNEKISEEEIISYTKSGGLKKGSLAKKHDAQMLEWHIVNQNSGLAHVEVNIQGSCANIIVRETTGPAEMKSDDDIPINIVASRYGVIRKMDVFDGQDSVKIGDAVMKGDLLVSAVYEDRHNKLTLKHARAKIIAETDYSIEAVFPLEQKINKTAGIKKTNTLVDFMGAEIKLGNNKNTDNLPSRTDKKQLRFLWINLPINLITTRYFDVKSYNITYDFEQGRDGAKNLLDEMEKEQLKDASILKKTTSEWVKNNEYHIKADYICLMDIAEEQPIESNIPWENTDDIS